ncbi:MAG TPA: GAF domain-containing sensor histidine kinase [Baekduia sp.]|nr:GAF domain-containing sensor histidine kinase [Baekduia sp.]
MTARYPQPSPAEPVVGPGIEESPAAAPVDRAERLQAVLDAARSIASELDLDAVLDRLLSAALAATGAKYAAIGVLNEQRDALERFVTRGIDEPSARTIGDLPRGRGILGLLITDPKPLRLTSVGRHPRSYGFPPGHPPMERFLGVPIIIHGEPWGNLYLTDKADADFDEDDEEAAILLAGWASIAVSNARQFQQSERRRKELERATATLEVTTDIARAVGGEIDLDRILELLVKRGRALVEARAVAIALLEGMDLVFAAGAGEFDPASVGARTPVERSPLAGALHSLRPVRESRFELRRSWEREAFGVEEASTFLAVPLVFKGQPLGALVAVDRVEDDLGAFTAEHERLLGAFAASAALAMATAQAVADQRVREAIGASERERARWARELHDETLQELAALNLHLSAALKAAERGVALDEHVRHAVGQVQRQVSGLRDLITDLRPADLDELGLESALRALAERHGGKSGLRVELDLQAPESTPRLPPELETTIYRLAQEALTNVVKHAEAATARMRLVEGDQVVELEVRDDGRGFDPGARADGFGMLGMRERAELVGGRLDVVSGEAGTLVRALLPVSPHAGS